MRHSESIADLATALAAAQGAFPVIPKDRTVTVKMRSGGQYTFAYAPLDTVISKTRQPLAENCLAVTQGVITDEKGAEFIRTILLHKSGQWMSNDTPLFSAAADNASQGYASGMSYARRYGYNAILCIAADDDDDGNGNEDGQRNGGQQQERSQQPRSDRPAQPRAKQQENAPRATQDAQGGINGLTDGQRKLLMVKARNAGYPDEAELLKRHPSISPANLNEILDALKVEAEQADAA